MLSRRAPAFPDLCLQKSKGTWAPSPEALKSIFQAKKFVALDGASEQQGDLKVRFAAIPTTSPHETRSTLHNLSLCAVGGPPLDEAAAC